MTTNLSDSIHNYILAFANTGGSSSNRGAHQSNSNSGGGGGWLKYLLMALIVLLLLGYFGFRTGCNAVDQTASNVSDTTTGVVDATADMAAAGANAIGDAVKNIAGLTMDATGNLTDKAGNVLAKAGTYTKDAAGNIVDASGNMIYRAVDGVVVATPNTENMTAGTGADGLPTAGEITYTVNETGDLIDTKGNIFLKAGEFTESEDGYYVDKNGNRIGRVFKKIGKAIANAADAVGGAVGDAAGAVGNAAGAVGNAVGDAAKKTGEFFTGIFKKKDSKGYTHTLSNIEFDPEGHRITNFSKAEVQGLAYALQQNPDAKIEVQAFTKDGKNNIENKSLSTLRAKVVEDMLVTLGVDKKQISSKGMGAKDSDKATANKMEIVVE